MRQDTFLQIGNKKSVMLTIHYFAINNGWKMILLTTPVVSLCRYKVVFMLPIIFLISDCLSLTSVTCFAFFIGRGPFKDTT